MLLKYSCLAVYVLIGASVSLAQSTDDSIRFRYTDDNAPQYVLFGVVIDDIFQTSLHPHDGNYCALHSGACDETDLREVFDYLVLLWLEMDKEYGTSMMRMLCPAGDKPPKGDDLFLVFDALDDVKAAIHYKYYAIAKSELIARHSFNLDEALKNYPIGFNQVWGDHEKWYEGSVEQAENVAKAICEKGHRTEFTRSGQISD